MASELIQKMHACAECRLLAVDYGLELIASRRPRADPRDHGLRLTVRRLKLDEHLISTHAAWLPDRQPNCVVCDAWTEDHTISPIEEAEALHRAWHLCEALREICYDGRNGNEGLAYLII
ncbi:hypothetical protein AB0G82_32705 [Streptomyces anulatus]|uniref:hypothetical protein n=1 Tax=Streptomyces anulatus TaxID=1892 RepID=UPI0033E118E9